MTELQDTEILISHMEHEKIILQTRIDHLKINRIALLAGRERANREEAEKFWGELLRPMDTSPLNGDVVRLTVGGMTFLARWQEDLIDFVGDPWRGWVAIEEGHHPASWTHGRCWAAGDICEESEQPTGWLPVPPRETVSEGEKP